MPKLFLNFDFYGAGNIGDDLMLDGFVKSSSVTGNEMICSIPRRSDHQKFRFPEITFVQGERRYDEALQCPVWVGVGDTPVQIKSGDWFLLKLEKDFSIMEGTNTHCFMIGVGAEREASLQSQRYRRVLSKCRNIWTRDEMSRSVLINEFRLNEDVIKVSSDLANISLSRLFEPESRNTIRRYELGVCYYDENVYADEISALKEFLKVLTSEKNKVLLFANEVNQKGMFETAIYRRMYPMTERLLKRKISFIVPDYFSENSLPQILQHYSQCRTIMTSRYHALLTAAWAGCKVVALERSSKVSSLAKELGIEEVKKPFTVKELLDAYERAATVEVSKLEHLAATAAQSITEFHNLIS
jgi:polysaccharide pyruvyl transferase WcaK-like protein